MGELRQAGAWVDNNPIELSLDGLLIGTYLYIIVVEDAEGLTASTSGYVEVIARPAPISKSFFDNPFNISLTVAIVTAGLSYGIITYRNRLSAKREADVEGRAKDYLNIARRIQEDQN